MAGRMRKTAIFLGCLFFLAAAGCGGGGSGGLISPAAPGSGGGSPPAPRIAFSGRVLRSGSSARSGARGASNLPEARNPEYGPAAGVEVVLAGSGSSFSTLTDENGEYRFSDIDDGEYSVTVMGRERFSLELDGENSFAALIEVRADGGATSQIIRGDGSDGYYRRLDPDGGWYRTSPDEGAAVHLNNGLTGFDRQGNGYYDHWILDWNDNGIDYSLDFYPSTPDYDGDGCPDMLDFNDNDNNNNGIENYRDPAYNLNAVALMTLDIELPDNGCFLDSRLYKVKLEADKTRGVDALDVNFEVQVKAAEGMVAGYHWYTGDPDTPRVEIESSELYQSFSHTYSSPGIFVAVAVVLLADGNRMLATQPIYVSLQGRFAEWELVLLNTVSLDASPSAFAIDLFGNMYMHLETNPETLLAVYDGTGDKITEFEDHAWLSLGMAVDHRGFIYVQEVAGPIRIFDIHGNIWGEFAGPSGLDTGLAIDENGFLYSSRYRIDLNNAYMSERFITENWRMVWDIEVGPDGNIYYLTDGGVRVYSPAGAHLRTIKVWGETMAIAPDSSILLAGLLAGKVYLYDQATGMSRRILEFPGGVVGLHVDPIGRLFVANYYDRAIYVYGPEVLLPADRRPSSALAPIAVISLP